MKTEAPAELKSVGFALFPERGAYYPTFKLARLLKTQGLRVVYFGPSEFKQDILAQGFEFHVMLEDQYGAGIFDGNPLPESMGQFARLKHMALLRRKKMTIMYEALLRGEITLEITAQKIDLLVIDALLGPLAIKLSIDGVRVATVATELVGTDRTVAPHYSTLICGSKTRFLKLKIALNWFAFDLVTLLNKGLLATLEFIADFPRPDRRLQQLQNQLDLLEQQHPAKSMRCEYGKRPAFPEFVLCPREFEFPMALVNSKRIHLGHCIDLDRQEPHFAWEKLTESPLVYCSLGTHVADYPHANHFFRVLLATAKAHPQYQFVISMGPGRKIEEFGPVPDNVIAQTRVPQIGILKRAAVMLTNGGLGTVKECMYFAVPVLVLPCDFDQPGNSARVCYHNIGRRARLKNITREILGSEIHHLIHNTAYKNNMLEFRKKLMRDEGFEKGIESLFALIGSTSHPNNMSQPMSQLK